MKTIIVPHRFYKDPNSNAGVSLYSSYIPSGYVLVEKGFTTQNEDGTSGNGNKPFTTREEGEAWLTRFEERTGRPFRGMSAFTN